MTAGPAIEAAALPSAENVAVHRWLPHAAVLPHAALVIPHGGHSTVVKALAYGVPLLCLPLGRDQYFIAHHVQALGAGRSLASNETPAALKTAITTLLRDSFYREAAQHVADAIQRTGPGEASAAAEIEAIGRR